MMEELEQILREHAKRYPLMQPTDAIKLIYQNEFGGGHLIRDEEACLNYLRREYTSVAKDPTVPLYEDIGNGIIRVNLAAVKPKIWSSLVGHSSIPRQSIKERWIVSLTSWKCCESLRMKVYSTLTRMR